MICIGVDPGISGAVAFVGHLGEYIAVEDMPVMERGPGKRQVNPRALREILLLHAGICDKNEIMVTIERVSAMPGQGVTACFNFGHTFGIIEGVVASMGYSYELVTPQSWKKDAGLIGATKGASRTLATRLFPGAPLTLAKHEGRAEALLIARFGHKRHS